MDIFQDAIAYSVPNYNTKTNNNGEGGHCYLFPKCSMKMFCCYDEWNSLISIPISERNLLNTAKAIFAKVLHNSKPRCWHCYMIQYLTYLHCRFQLRCTKCILCTSLCSLNSHINIHFEHFKTISNHFAYLRILILKLFLQINFLWLNKSTCRATKISSSFLVRKPYPKTIPLTLFKGHSGLSGTKKQINL